MNNTSCKFEYKKFKVFILSYVIDRFGRFSLIPFIPLLLISYQYTALQIGIILSLNALSSSIFSLMIGYFIDKYGVKAIMRSSLIASSIAMATICMAKSVLLFCVISIVIGTAKAGFTISTNVHISNTINIEKKHWAFSLLFFWGSNSSASAVIFGSFFALANQFKIIIFMISLLYLVALIFLNISMYGEGRRIEFQTKQSIDTKKILRSLLENKALIYMILAIFCVCLIHSQIDSSFPQYLTQHIMNGKNIYIYILAANAVCILTLQIPLHQYLKNKLFHFSVTAGCIFLFSSLLLFSFSRNLVEFICSAILYSFSQMILFPLNSIMVEKIAVSNKGLIFGASNLGLLGLVVGPLMGSFYINHSYNQLFFLTLLSLVILIFVLYYTALTKMEFTHIVESIE